MHLVLNGIAGNEHFSWVSAQDIVNTVALVLEQEKGKLVIPQKRIFVHSLRSNLVQATVGIGRLTLALEGDDHEANEDVDHEEGEDDDVDHVEEEHVSPVVEDGSLVLGVGIDGSVEDLWPSFKGLREHKIKKTHVEETAR